MRIIRPEIVDPHRRMALVLFPWHPPCLSLFAIALKSHPSVPLEKNRH